VTGDLQNAVVNTGLLGLKDEQVTDQAARQE
jgi:hypothetical protein